MAFRYPRSITIATSLVSWSLSFFSIVLLIATIRLGGFFFYVVILPVIACAALMIERARSVLRVARTMCAPPAEVLLREDRRPPILYLRPFVYDEKTLPQVDLEEWGLEFGGVREEEIIAEVFGAHGPLIALSDPRRRRHPLGAARLTPPQGKWQDIVAEYAASAQLIILSGGITTGILEEIRIALAAEPRRFLLHVSDSLARNYGMFHRQVQGALRARLPEEVGPARWLWFDEDWQAHPLPAPARPATPELARECAEAARKVVRPLLCSPNSRFTRTLRRLRHERWVVAGSVAGILVGFFLIRAQAAAPPDDLLGLRTAGRILDHKAEVLAAGLGRGNWADRRTPRPTHSVSVGRYPRETRTTVRFTGLPRGPEFPRRLGDATFPFLGWERKELDRSESSRLHMEEGSTYAYPGAEYPDSAVPWIESAPTGAIGFQSTVSAVRVIFLGVKGDTRTNGISAFNAEGEWLAMDLATAPRVCCSRWQAWDTMEVSTRGNHIDHVHVWGDIYVFALQYSRSLAGEVSPAYPLSTRGLLGFHPQSIDFAEKCRMDHRFPAPAKEPGG